MIYDLHCAWDIDHCFAQSFCFFKETAGKERGLIMIPAKELIKGAVDMHLHSGPALIKRGYDHVEVVRAAIDAGMRAVVIKDHHMPDGGTCQLVQKYFVKPEDNFNVYGSMAMGNPLGGINPAIVEIALEYDTKVFWMPVMSAKYGRERMDWLRENRPEYRQGVPATSKQLLFDPPMTILDDFGKLLPEVSTVCRLIAEGDAVLATGHISKEETYKLLDEAVRQGCKKIVITHAEYFHDFSYDEMRQFQDAGFYVEHILTTLYSGKQSYDGLYEMLKAHGAKKTIISSDLGQPGRPAHPQGILSFIEAMQERGVADEDIRRITSDNQKYLLGIID